MIVSLYKLLENSARAALQLQNEDGSFPKGHNGPWNDNDTYVRTTAHWALLQYKAFEITGDEKYKNSAEKACDYLIKKECRPYGYTFHCRSDRRKDNCNGLIGQAWALEALLFVGKQVKQPEYLDCAKDVFDFFEYSFSRHLWPTIEIDGRCLGFHVTLNQQVWLSAMALLAGGKSMEEKAHDFFLNLPRITVFFEDRLIKHRIKNALVEKATRFILNPKKAIRFILNPKLKNDMIPLKVLSVGYVPFILFGVAIAYRFNRQSDFWKNKALKTLIKDTYLYVKSHKPYGYGSDGSDYRWGYNTTGFEIACFIQECNTWLGLNEKKEEIESWIGLQLNGHYDFNNGMMTNNTIDPNILAARLYAAAYLDNYSIEINDS